MGDEGNSRTPAGAVAARTGSRPKAHLFVGIFQLLIAGVASYVGASDSRRVPVVAGIVMLAAAAVNLLKYRRQPPSPPGP
jgi:hypothetical protein